MPGATPVQGFPYPFQAEAATPVSAQNLATEVDTELTAADAVRALALARPSASASRLSGTQSLTSGSPATLTLDTENWDTGGMWAPGNPERLTLPTTATYHVAASYVAVAALEADNDVYEIAVRLNAGSNIAANKRPQYSSLGFDDDRWLSLSFLYRFTAGAFIDIRAFWQATGGGTRNIGQATLTARLVAL